MEQSTQNISQIQEDTIDLRELFATLKKRKKLIGTVTAALTILAIVYAFFIAKPTYEVQASMELAQIDKKPVQNAEDLKQKIETVYEVNAKGKKIEFPILKSVTLPKKTKSILLLKAQGRDNESAIHKLEEVVSYTSKLQNRELNFFSEAQKKKLELARGDIKQSVQMVHQIKSDIDNYKEKLLNISKEDAALAGIYSIEIGKKQTELYQLENKVYALKNKINDYELSISPLKIHKTTIIGEMLVLDHPVKPKKALIVIVAFITGLMLSVFLAFFLEFLAGFKEEENASAIH